VPRLAKLLRVPTPADRGPGQPWRPGTPPPAPIPDDSRQPRTSASATPAARTSPRNSSRNWTHWPRTESPGTRSSPRRSPPAFGSARSSRPRWRPAGRSRPTPRSAGSSSPSTR
jgi:hypothetical protein